MIEGASISHQENRLRKQAAFVSLIVGVALMIIKFWAHNLTGSQAIYSDAMESIVNVVAATLALFVIYYAAKPVDEDHPYGHGKVEYFSAAFEGGLITLAAVLIAVDAVKKFLDPEPLMDLSLGLALVVVAGIANMLLGFFLIRRGKATGSLALRASGKHVLTDFWTSAGVITGLAVVWLTDWFWLDPVLALGVGLYLGYQGVKLVRESVSGLMDAEDPQVLKDLAAIFSEQDLKGIIQIHNVRVIRSGWYHHIDAHVVLPEFWPVTTVHQVMQKFERKVIDSYRYGGEMNFHVDPCQRKYCQACDVVNCPIRVSPFQQKIEPTVETLRSPNEPI
jgi:cation diffusion facilitator family transporter